MNNHWQVGFLSVLLILILFFSLMKPEEERSFEVIRPTEFEGMIHFTCDVHSIEITNDGLVIFRGKALNLNEFVSGLKKLECPTHGLMIKAGENTETGIVMEASNKLVQALPELTIAWGESGT